MNMISRKSNFYIVLLSCLLVPLLAGAQSVSPAEDEARAMVRQIYREVSSDGSSLPDWEKLRSFFVDEAVVVLRTSREGNTQFTLDEFIQDFKDFYQRPSLGDAGFKEEVIQLKSHVYHDIAFIAVLYEAGVLNSDRPPQKGIDFWLLTKKEGAWKVVSVVNEIIRPGEELPSPFDQP
jgi:hypothetical protein